MSPLLQTSMARFYLTTIVCYVRPLEGFCRSRQADKLVQPVRALEVLSGTFLHTEYKYHVKHAFIYIYILIIYIERERDTHILYT